MSRPGHDLRPVPRVYVNPFVTRHNNDTDAEAVARAAQRPRKRTVAGKSPERQAQSMPFRTRSVPVGQRMQPANALRAHFAKHGIVTGRAVANVAGLAAMLEKAEVPALRHARVTKPDGGA